MGDGVRHVPRRADRKRGGVVHEGEVQLACASWLASVLRGCPLVVGHGAPAVIG